MGMQACAPCYALSGKAGKMEGEKPDSFIKRNTPLRISLFPHLRHRSTNQEILFSFFPP
jgi:hypothetical protein